MLKSKNLTTKKILWIKYWQCGYLSCDGYVANWITTSLFSTGTYDMSDGLYDAPYASVRGSGPPSTQGYPHSANYPGSIGSNQYHGYEPEPRRPHAVTVNGVAVR